MRTVKIFSVVIACMLFLKSCSREEVIIVEEPGISLNQLLESYDLWYIDINSTQGFGETPFLQIAFTISFNNGIMYANNNLVGFGSQGNGLGVDIGNYDAYDMILDVDHVIDGFDSFDVYQIDNNTIELYNPFNDTSYFLDGYQRQNFDYDFIFYDNIHYFLQEYEAWEKVYTSNFGALNEFDNENYLQFVPGGNNATFRSSQDTEVTNLNAIFWDYEGVYDVGDVADDMYLKTLTLDYDFMNNELFELNVINDTSIELFHPNSGTVYEFTGRGYIQFYRDENVQSQQEDLNKKPKRRIQISPKIENPRTNTRS